MSENKTYNIIVFGAEDVGKSTLITRYVENSTPSLLQSIFNYYTKVKEIEFENENIIIKFEKFSNIEDISEEKIKLVNAIILMYDVTIPDTCDEIIQGRTKIFKYIEPIYIKHFPLIVIGNKFDSENQKIIENIKLNVFLKNFNYQNFYISALKIENIEYLFTYLLTNIKLFNKMKSEGKFENLNNNRDKENCCKLF